MDNLDSQHILACIQSMDFHNSQFCIRKLEYRFVRDIPYSVHIVLNRNHLVCVVVVLSAVNSVRTDFHTALLDMNRLDYDLQPCTMQTVHMYRHMDPSNVDSNTLY